MKKGVSKQKGSPKKEGSWGTMGSPESDRVDSEEREILIDEI